MTEQEQGLIEETREFAKAHDINWSEGVELIVLNSFRYGLKSAKDELIGLLTDV
jgi:hypothetical protein